MGSGGRRRVELPPFLPLHRSRRPGTRPLDRLLSLLPKTIRVTVQSSSRVDPVDHKGVSPSTLLLVGHRVRSRDWRPEEGAPVKAVSKSLLFILS